MIRYWQIQKWSAVTLKILSPTVLTMSSLGISSDYSSYKCPIRQYCFQKKKKKKRRDGEERIFFAFLIGGRTILQKISGDFPSIPMVRTGKHALPRVIKRDMLQGSHTFSLCSGKRASPAKKVMVNPPWEGRQHRLPLSPVPTPHCSR